MLGVPLLVMMMTAHALDLPDSCGLDQFYDPGSLSCLNCLANSSMVKSLDGFGCACGEHSIPASVDRCKSCSASELVSSDGAACVPRKCQSTTGRLVCRKCPADYISITQNPDGSPTKEVSCVKCARGYKVQANACVRCEACSCSRSQLVILGTCLPKNFVNARPKYEGDMHPMDLLDVVKQEYLCTKNDFRACRALANKCVKHFYSSDLGGPCQLWLQPKIPAPKGLPPLIINPSPNDKLGPGEIIIPRHGKNILSLVLAVYTFTGGFKFLTDKNDPCQLPLNINIGEPVAVDCQINLTELLASDYNETFAPFLYTNGEYMPLTVMMRKTNGYNVQRGTWPSNRFRRYFMVHNSISKSSNITNTIYLRTLLISLRLERVKHMNGSLRLTITMDAQYATSSLHHGTVTTTLKVEYVLPNAGVLRGLEIWGGVLGAFLTVFALAQWRGALRRGGYTYSVLPLLAGCVADTLYFSALFSTLHALAAEAGTLSMTLPLAHSEERMVKAFLYSAVALKVLKVAWVNWQQCTCDILFLDWSEYNPPMKEAETKDKTWKAKVLAREWCLLQAKRRASPGYTVTLALLFLHLITPWKVHLPNSVIYAWCVASIAWWASHGLVLCVNWTRQRLLRASSAAANLQHICTGVGMSLMLFQEEHYAHYVHGRNDDSKEVRSMAGPLAMCRVACVPQLRAVCRQLSPGMMGDSETRQALLSRFLGAFFERALDGLNWVASERSVLERLLDVELTSRESGNTSALLYDDDTTPSCLNMTWWGEEWNLSTCDAMVFSCAYVGSGGDEHLAAFVTLSVWQIMKQIRIIFGNKNQVDKTGVDIHF